MVEAPALAADRHPPLIDCHAHIFGEDLPVTSGAWISPDYAFPAERLLSLLDENGIHFGVISGLSITGYYNDYMLSELQRNKRLRGTVIVPPDVDRFTLERMAANGVIGIRLQLARQTDIGDFRSDEWRLLLRRVRDLDWHVHIAIEGEYLRPVLGALLESGVKTVIDHFGHPNPACPEACDGMDAISAAVDGGRTWVKMSGGFRLSGTEAWQDPDADLESVADRAATELIRRVGTDRLLWGSDAPFVGYEGRVGYPLVLENYFRWVPDSARRAEIDRTALQLYFS